MYTNTHMYTGAYTYKRNYVGCRDLLLKTYHTYTIGMYIFSGFQDLLPGSWHCFATFTLPKATRCLPHDGLADVRGDEERDAGAKPVSLHRSCHSKHGLILALQIARSRHSYDVFGDETLEPKVGCMCLLSAFWVITSSLWVLSSLWVCQASAFEHSMGSEIR